MRIRLAIIGLGNVAKAQLGALKRVDDIVLTCAHDIDKEKRSILTSDASFFDSLDALLASNKADVVLVST